MVNAFHCHARLYHADTDVLRHRIDHPFPRGGDVRNRRRVFCHQSPQRIAASPHSQRLLHGTWHCRHALHRHGGNAGARRPQLRPHIRCALPDHSDRSLDGGTMAGIPNHGSWAKAHCRRRHGRGHFRYALRGDGRDHFCSSRSVPEVHPYASLDQTNLALAVAGTTFVILASALIASLSEQKRAEEALREAQANLAHVSRVTTMGELCASLAHEVNQPIAAAVANADACLNWLARDNPNLEKARESAMRIVEDGTRAAEIISRIRLLFKKGTPQRELVDVNEVIRGLIVLLRSQITQYLISVRMELAADLPQVRGDRVQLQQVMMNLMMNSIDAMKDVDGTRELAIKSHRTGNEQLMVCVSDSGVGLPSQQADQIFHAFFTTKPHGIGMGLAICRSIVESHSGRLWAADNSPRGASFHVILPTSSTTHQTTYA